MTSRSENRSFTNPIEKHPPERRQRKKEYLVLYSCCCCCCCCLHTIGGAIGAAYGGNSRAEAVPSEPPSKTYRSSQFLYWTSFLSTVVGATILGVVWLFVIGVLGFFASQNAGFERSNLDIMGAVMTLLVYIGISLIMAGPLWLLAASVVMAIRLALRRDLPDKSVHWRQLVRITQGAVVGSVAGILIMVAIFFAIT